MGWGQKLSGTEPRPLIAELFIFKKKEKANNLGSTTWSLDNIAQPGLFCNSILVPVFVSFGTGIVGMLAVLFISSNFSLQKAE